MSKVFVLVITIFFADPHRLTQTAAFHFATQDACQDAQSVSEDREGSDGIIDVEAECFEVDNAHAKPT